MKYLYLDFETRMTKNLKLSKMTTRSYCEETNVTMLAWALDDEPVQYQLGSPNDHTLGLLRAAAESEDTCFVAFNASFDIRVLHITLGLPYPRHFLCALELSRAAWPNQPGGYSLDNLAVQLGLKYKKLKVNLEEVSGQELIDYCKMDVEVLREVFKLEQSILPPEEFQVCELSNRAKTITFSIDTKRVLEAVDNMSKMAGDAALDVAHAFGDDPEILKAYGWHGDKVPDSIEAAKKMTPKSVKPAKVKELLLSRLNIDFITTGKSTSIKQINPAELARMPEQAQVLLKKGGELGRALSHRRSLSKFSGITLADCELSYAAAHTLRFASRNEGSKGLNLHNMPKHDKRIAEPFRRSFVLPDGYVWVCGDFANVEYRGEGLITGCEFVLDMFSKNPFADPYSAFGEWATGLTIDRSTSIGKALRQLFKAAVLGLGYMMGLRTWMVQLLKVLASGSVTLDDLRNLASEKRWRRCSSWAQKAIKELGCEEIVGIVGEHIHELFHQRHPEFAKFGRWMEGAVSRLSYAHNPEAVLSELYLLPGAPNRSVLDMSVDRRLGGSSIRASTSGYPASVCWRDLAIRESSRGPCLTSVLAGHKSPRPITPNILIENFVQYWARTALVMGQAQLENLGHPLQLSIHDEAKILCKNEPQAILNARADLLQVFGPGNNLGFGWAIMVDPATVTVSRSLWDDEAWCQKVFWPRLESGDESVLGELT